MREIEFRGKRVDNGEWVYGYVWKNPREQYFITEYNTLTMYAVIPESVGQCTGLKDRNGVNIFEGDKCSFGVFKPRNKAIVRFENARFILVWSSIVGVFEERARHSEHLMFAETIEIIGNIHDEED